MEHYERVAIDASHIELRIDYKLVHDDLTITEYRGPELLVFAHAGRLVTIHEQGRQLDDLTTERMAHLLELGLAACAEPQARPGPDTALARPITFFHIAIRRELPAARATLDHSINHYGPRALGPLLSRFLAALREAAGPLPPTASRGWDLAGTWFAPIDLGVSWNTGQAVPLPSLVNAFSHEGIVYFRTGQPPQRTELYRLDGDGLVWLRDNADPMPLTVYDGRRFILPCGAGTIELRREWNQPRRIYVRVDDPVRGIWVQRD